MLKKQRSPFVNFFVENLGILGAFLAIGLIITVLKPVFFSLDNALSVGRQISTNALLALGMGYVMISGGIDLSVGAVAALAGTLTVGFINSGVPIPLGFALGILSGLAFGMLNGVIIAKTGMAPFIVTMSTMNIARGIAYIYSGGLPIRCMEDAFAAVGTGYLWIIPLPVIYLIFFTIIASLTLVRSKFGTYVYALGGNREAARFSGIQTKKVEIIVYSISGLLAGVAGVVLSSRMYSGQPSVLIGAELDAIAACVLGGVSMAGGLGKVGGIIIGTLIIGIISNGLNLLNTNSFWQLVVKGVIVLFAVYLDVIRKNRMEKA